MKFTRILLAAVLLLLAEAAAESTRATGGDTYSFKLGEWNATVIKDGIIGGNVFNFFSVPAFVVERNFRYYYPRTDFAIPMNVLLLRNQNNVLLIDSGGGGVLVERLRSMGIMPEDVTAVLLTHVHGDHILGLFDESNNARFPNARIYVNRREDAFWRQSAADVAAQAPLLPLDFVVNPTTMNYQNFLKAYMSRIQLMNDFETPFAGITTMLTNGHTPGHTAYMIQSENMRLAVVGDSVISRTTDIQHPDWNIISDKNRTTAVSTKYKLMDRLADERTMTLVYHVDFPGLGYIVRECPSFDFSTAVRIA